MVIQNLLPALESRFNQIKNFKMQFDFASQRLDVKSILFDKNQKELYLRSFSQGKDIKVSTIEDLVIFLKTIDTSSIELTGEPSASSEVGSNINGFFIEEDIKTIVFSWLIDPETTNPNHISLEG